MALGDRATIEVTVQQANGPGAPPITVFLDDGTTVGARAGRGPAVELAFQGRSLTAREPGGTAVLVAVQSGRRTSVIRTFVTSARLREGVARAWTVLGLLGLVLLGIGVVVADRLARSLVQLVAAVARVSHRLAGGDLDARVRPEGPAEIREVGTALNHLADRIRELLQREREGIADLSHRLRTPLTALRLEIETLRDTEGAVRVAAAVDAVEVTVDQLIREARRSNREVASGSDAAKVVAERVGFWAALAEDQSRTAEVFLAGGPLPVRVGPEDLAACVDAVLENVFAHTPEGTAFEVRLTAREDGGALLVISDAGPGFSRLDLLDRGASGAASTGLGLDIADRTARGSGGELRVGATATGGARISLTLGPA